MPALLAQALHDPPPGFRRQTPVGGSLNFARHP
jgi:hypothetical protein